MTYAYFRQISEHNNLAEQQHAVLSFSLTKNLPIDKEVLEHSVHAASIEERTSFESFLRSRKLGDTIIVKSLAVLSMYMEEAVKVLNCMLSHKLNLYVVDTNTLINEEANVVEMLPLLNELRNIKKAKTRRIGRPKGSRSVSKFDVHHSEIITLIKEGTSVSAIARELEVSRSSLKDYIESRDIKELAGNSWTEISRPKADFKGGNHILICPFEQDDQI